VNAPNQELSLLPFKTRAVSSEDINKETLQNEEEAMIKEFATKYEEM